MDTRIKNVTDRIQLNNVVEDELRRRDELELYLADFLDDAEFRWFDFDD